MDDGESVYVGAKRKPKILIFLVVIIFFVIVLALAAFFVFTRDVGSVSLDSQTPGPKIFGDSRKVNELSLDEETRIASDSWCEEGASWVYAGIENSGLWIIQEIRYFRSEAVCYAEKENSSVNYYFTADNKKVFSVIEDSSGRKRIAELDLPV